MIIFMGQEMVPGKSQKGNLSVNNRNNHSYFFSKPIEDRET